MKHQDVLWSAGSQRGPTGLGLTWRGGRGGEGGAEEPLAGGAERGADGGGAAPLAHPQVSVDPARRQLQVQGLVQRQHGSPVSLARLGRRERGVRG